MNSIDNFITAVGTMFGRVHTPEQREFIKYAPLHNTISMSCAGSGKTTTLVDTVITAVRHYKIPAEKINVMSFTTKATANIKRKYEDACSTMYLPPSARKVSFLTLDAMARRIIIDHAEKIGIRYVEIMDMGETIDNIDYIQRALKNDFDQEVSIYDAGFINRVINELDSKFIYNERDIQSNYSFKTCSYYTGLTVEMINKLRVNIYHLCKSSGKIPVSMIPKLAYEILLTVPEVGQEYKDQYEMMMIDEIQDMSTLQLLILKEICNHVVAIGDVNQQIYGFRGASNATIEYLKHMYPDLEHKDLTYSFRCTEQIADLGRKVIRPNNTDGERIQTNKVGKEPEITQASVANILQRIIDDFNVNGQKLTKTQLILYRNNYSAFEVIDTLYAAGVPIQNPKYKSFMELNIFYSVFRFINLIQNPADIEMFDILQEFLPDLAYGTVRKEVLDLMKKTRQPINQISFQYRNQEMADRLFRTWAELEDDVLKGNRLLPIVLDILEMYKANTMDKRLAFLNMDYESVVDLARTTIKDMRLLEFLDYENKKKMRITEDSSRGYGIECLTIHSAKGLEADRVFIFDVSDGVMPNGFQIKKRIKTRCYNELVDMIREERSVLYVAITRAAEELYIHYDGELSTLISDPYCDALDFSIHADPPVSTDELIDSYKGFIERVQS